MPITIEQQLAHLAEIGIALNDGVTIDDLTSWTDREGIESEPYSRLVETLGYDLQRKPYTPISNSLWMCDYERIEDHGDYKAVIHRLEQ